MFQDKYRVRAELPGYSKDDVTLDVDGDKLILQGQRRQVQDHLA